MGEARNQQTCCVAKVTKQKFLRRFRKRSLGKYCTAAAESALSPSSMAEEERPLPPVQLVAGSTKRRSHCSVPKSAGFAPARQSKNRKGPHHISHGAPLREVVPDHGLRHRGGDAAHIDARPAPARRTRPSSTHPGWPLRASHARACCAQPHAQASAECMRRVLLAVHTTVHGLNRGSVTSACWGDMPCMMSCGSAGSAMTALPARA